jgi:hypothetical protein
VVGGPTGRPWIGRFGGDGEAVATSCPSELKGAGKDHHVTDRRAEYAALYQETLALAEFFDSITPGMRAAVESAATPQRPLGRAIAGLRGARSDLLVMSASLTGEQQRQLDAHVRKRLGVPLDSLQTRRLEKLSQLREEGRITSEEQWRLIRGRLDQIEGDPAFANEAIELASLAATYELTAMRRGRPRKSSS